MPRKEPGTGIFADVLRGVLTTAILATAAAAFSTWVEVKLLRHDLDELRKDVDRLWSDTSEYVAALQGGETPSERREIELQMAKLREKLAKDGTLEAAAASVQLP